MYSSTHNNTTPTPTQHSTNSNNWAIVDSGASNHYLTTKAPATEILPATSPISITLPDGTTVESTHTCLLDLPQLPLEARRAHIIPQLASHSLISVPTLCNAGCHVHFAENECTISYKNNTIMCATKCDNTNMWMIPLSTPQHIIPPTNNHTHDVNNTVNNCTHFRNTSTQHEYATFIHQALGSPPASTLLQALERSTELITIPGLTKQLITTHLRRVIATDKGHMRRVRQGIASTRPNQPTDESPQLHPPIELASHAVFCFAVLTDTTAGTMYTDLTGNFPVRSLRNMTCIFVAYVYDINAIIVRAMPSHTDAAMIDAFTSILDELTTRGHTIHLNIMDNECSKAVAKHLRANKVDLQLVPPHNHRVNAAERAIATFKEHFIATLATVDPTCPLQLWDEFLPQVQLTLNMLRFSRINPNKNPRTKKSPVSLTLIKHPLHC